MWTVYIFSHLEYALPYTFLFFFLQQFGTCLPKRDTIWKRNEKYHILMHNHLVMALKSFQFENRSIKYMYRYINLQTNSYL